MSNNPLRDLLALMEGMTEKTQLMDYYSSVADSPREGHLRALGLLSETVRACEAISTEDDDVVADNQDLFELLWKKLTLPEHNWVQTRMNRLSGSDLIAARNLARTLDHAGSLPKTLGVEELEGLRVALEKLREEIGSISEIPDNLRNYLFYLIARCFSILDGDDVDLTTLRSLSFEIGGAVLGAVSHAPKEKGQVLFERLGEVLGPWLMNVSSGAVAGFISAAATAGVIAP